MKAKPKHGRARMVGAVAGLVAITPGAVTSALGLGVIGVVTAFVCYGAVSYAPAWDG